MSEELTTVEVTDEIKVVMENKNFIPSSEDIECYGKHQIKPSEILPCPFCGSRHLYFGDWGMHGTQDKVSCGNECIERVPVETWNSRPAEEALQKRIAELEAERDRMREALRGLIGKCRLRWQEVNVSRETIDAAFKALEGIGK